MVYHPTARVLSVLELLQTHRQMTGPDLAARLEVDVRTIRRYITTLQDMGIPIDADIGRYGGYTLRPGFKLPPLMFSGDEVLAVTLGLLLAQRSALAGMSPTVESTLAKIERVLPFDLRERFRALQETMQMDRPAVETPVDGKLIAALTLASRQHQQVRMLYDSGRAVTERRFDPYGVACLGGSWYTVGYCHLRAATRVFRLDRIQRIERLEPTFTPPPDFDILTYLESSFEAIPDRWTIEILLDMPLETIQRRLPRSLATLVQEGDRVRLRSSVGDLDMIARVLIGLGCPLTIIQPLELRDSFLKISDQLRQIALAET